MLSGLSAALATSAANCEKLGNRASCKKMNTAVLRDLERLQKDLSSGGAAKPAAKRSSAAKRGASKRSSTAKRTASKGR